MTTYRLPPLQLVQGPDDEYAGDGELLAVYLDPDLAWQAAVLLGGVVHERVVDSAPPVRVTEYRGDGWQPPPAFAHSAPLGADRHRYSEHPSLIWPSRGEHPTPVVASSDLTPPDRGWRLENGLQYWARGHDKAAVIRRLGELRVEARSLLGYGVPV